MGQEKTAQSKKLISRHIYRRRFVVELEVWEPWLWKSLCSLLSNMPVQWTQKWRIVADSFREPLGIQHPPLACCRIRPSKERKNIYFSSNRINSFLKKIISELDTVLIAPISGAKRSLALNPFPRTKVPLVSGLSLHLNLIPFLLLWWSREICTQQLFPPAALTRSEVCIPLIHSASNGLLSHS